MVQTQCYRLNATTHASKKAAANICDILWVTEVHEPRASVLSPSYVFRSQMPCFPHQPEKTTNAESSGLASRGNSRDESFGCLEFRRYIPTYHQRVSCARILSGQGSEMDSWDAAGLTYHKHWFGRRHAYTTKILLPCMKTNGIVKHPECPHTTSGLQDSSPKSSHDPTTQGLTMGTTGGLQHLVIALKRSLFSLVSYHDNY